MQLEENELAIASSPKETSTLGEPTRRNSEEPEIDQYCKISNGNDSLNTLVIQKDPYIVQFFYSTARNDVYKLNDLKFEVLPEYFVQKFYSCGKKSSELCFLDKLSTNKHFYHCCCIILFQTTYRPYFIPCYNIIQSIVFNFVIIIAVHLYLYQSIYIIVLRRYYC